MGTRSSTRKRAGHLTPPGSPSRPADITELRPKQTADFRCALDADFAYPLFAAVLEGYDRKLAEVEAQLCEESRSGRPERAPVPVLRLQGDAEAVPGRTKQTLCAALRDPAGHRPHHSRVRGDRSTDQLRIVAHASDDPVASAESFQPCKDECHTLERQRERDHAAAVDGGWDLVLGHLCRLRVNGEHRALHRMARQPVTLTRPAVRTAEGEHPRVLARTIVVQGRRWIALRAALELVDVGGRLRQQRAHGGQLRLVGEMRSGCDCEVARVEVVPRACEPDRLQRRRRGAHERDERWIAGLGDDRTILHGDRVHAVNRLDGPAAAHGYPERLYGAETKCLSYPRWRRGDALSTIRFPRSRSSRPGRLTSRR